MPDAWFLPTILAQVTQGDVFVDVEVPDGIDAHVTPAVRIVLLTNSCDYDKPKHLGVHVVPLVSFYEIDPRSRGILGDVRKDRVPALLYIPESPAIPESFIDFRRLQRVPRQMISDAAGRRVASMTDDGRVALFDRMFAYFCRVQDARVGGAPAPVVGHRMRRADPVAE